jgi:hypothetical protein
LGQLFNQKLYTFAPRKSSQMARLLLTYLLSIVFTVFFAKGEASRHGLAPIKNFESLVSFVPTPLHTSPAEAATTTGSVIGFFDSSSVKLRTTKDDNTKHGVGLCKKLQYAKALKLVVCKSNTSSWPFDSNARLSFFKLFRI